MVGFIRQLWACIAVALMLVATSGSAWAGDYEDVGKGDKDAAREMFVRGDELYRAGKFEEALRAFIGADTIMRVPTTGLEVARSLVSLGRLVEARGYLKRVTETKPEIYEPKPFTEARREAKRLLREVDAKIAKVTIIVKGPRKSDVTARLGGTEIRTNELGKAILVDPGDHEVRLEAPGFEPLTKALTLEEGEKRKVKLVMEAKPGTVLPPEEPDESEEGVAAWWPYVAFGVGGASLIAGGITGGLSLAAASDFQERCDEGTRICPADAQADQDRALTLAHVSTVTLVVGGAMVSAGIVGLVLNLVGDDGGEDGDDSEAGEDAATIEPVVSPFGLGLRGRF